ncbi:AAA family ATPase [Streptomyces sp. NPDC059816]|uniref:helix-turn-helix transcriptional regulator n=1 Tax=Streptomyces sp. NPDC059816 TaxID=3346960 RepID=UPI0036562500
MVTALAGTKTRTAVRRTELEALRDLVRSATARRDATVELTGDPGSGKTALLAALAAEARAQGVVVLRGLCTATEREPVPLRPFAQAFGGLETTGAGGPALTLGTAALVHSLARPPRDPTALVPSGGGLTRGCHYFGELRRMIADCVAAVPHGLLLVLDDFHWADPCSVRLVEALMRRPIGGGLGIVIAHRPRQAPVGLRLAVRHGVELGTVEEVNLAPLTLAQSAELLAVRIDAPDLDRLHERSGGNPLHLTALAAEEGPPDDPGHLAVRRGLETRLLTECAPLDPDERLAAHAAAVLGESFDVESVAIVAQMAQDQACRALGSLRTRDLVRAAPRSSALAFRDPLLRDFLYGEADSCWRLAAHRRALTHLTALGALPFDLAPHVVLSGSLAAPRDRAVLGAAVKEALPAGRTALAAQWTAAALRLHRAAREPALAADPPTGPDATCSPGCELWLPVVQALAAEGDVTHLRTLTREILATLADLPPADRIPAVATIALVQATLGLPDEAGALLAPLLAALRGTGRPEAALQVQSQLVLVLAGQLPSRADVEVLARHTEAAPPITAAGALALRGLSTVFAGDLSAAETDLDTCAQILDGLEPHGPGTPAELGGADVFAGYLAVLACAESAMGWYGPAQAHAERALATARLRGDAHLLPMLLNVLAYVGYQDGRMSEALESAQEARSLARATGSDHHVALADAVTAAAWAWLGDAGPHPTRPDSHGAVTGEVPRTSVIALLHAEAALAAGDGHTALALLLPARDARRVPQPARILAARVYELLAAASVVTGVDATCWAERAETAAAEAQVTEQRGYALLARGHVLLARSLPADAAHCYHEAHALLGETTAGMRARDLARIATLACGNGETAAAADGLAELTLRERQVADLAGQGLKTRDIAERLLVSPRTVDVHLTRIYSKLGVHSRAALVRLLARAA